MIAPLNEFGPCFQFGQPIKSVYENKMTYAEYLLGILKKVNEVIKNVNVIQDKIDGYDERIAELETDINSLRQDFINYREETNANINARFEQIQTELNNALTQAVNQLRAYTDAKAAELQQQIDDVLIGNIILIDPTNGEREPLQIVINNIYDASREEAITAGEYDGLELTATYYDGLEITAFNYDRYAKTLLMPATV